MMECFNKAVELKPKFREKNKGIKISGDSGTKFRSQHGTDLIMTVAWGELINTAVARYNDAVNAPDEATKEAKYLEAADKFGMAIQVMPDSTLAHRNQAAAFMNTGKYEEAIDPLRKALEKDPSDVDVAKMLGQVYSLTGKEQESIDVFQKLWDGGNQSADIADQLARAYLNTDQKDKAIEIFKAAIEANPENTGFKYNYGLILLEAKEYNGAIEQLQSVYDIDPQTGDVVYNLGAAYLNLGVSQRDSLPEDSEDKTYLEAFKKALPFLEESLANNPDNSQIWFSLGQIAGQLNKMALAGYAFAKGDDKRQELEGKVVVGMSSEQVKAIFGEPSRVTALETEKFNIEEWNYAPSSNGKVQFEYPLNVYVDTGSGRVDAIMLIK
jgi:tetratricopeptide (TPR) repeat protein